MNFKKWLNELVYPGEPEKAWTTDDLIRKSGGAAMLTGTAPKKPWETPSSIVPHIPNNLNNGWEGQRKMARRIKSITPTGKYATGGGLH